MKNKLLVVYNTCGFSGREHVDWYIECIQNILNQDFDSFKVVISSCGNTQDVKEKLLRTFKKNISYSFTNEKLTVNQTFNHAVQNCVKKFGEFEGYFYIDSGVNFGDNKNVLADSYKLFKSGPYGLVTLQTDNDTGFKEWFNIDGQITGEDYIVPVGRACNLHAQIFSNEIFKAFGNKIIPDIFIAYCTESVFSFLAAATNQRWVIMKDLVLRHLKSIDGATCGFDHTGAKGDNKNNLFANLDIYEICKDPEAWDSGFGYEEMQGVFFHDPEKYDENGMVQDPERLRKFIESKIFLDKSVFDYEKVVHKFVGF